MLLNRFVFRHYYFDECFNCGFRYSANVSNFSDKEVYLNSKEGECPNCNKYNVIWNIVCITKKEEILPKI